MNVELKGVVKAIFEEKQINDNLSKKEFVVTIDGDTEYPQDIIIEAVNTKIDKLRGLAIGNKVIAKCNLRGRETKDGRYFNQIALWDLENKTNQ